MRRMRRTVLMTLGLLCWCPLFLMPGLLAQSATPTCRRHHLPPDASLEFCDIVYPAAKESPAVSPLSDHHHYGDYDEGGPRGSRRHARAARARDSREEEGVREDAWTSLPSELSYRVSSPLLFNDTFVQLRLIPISEFISPGFVIQRVSGNSTWLEEIGDLQCFYSGYVEGQADSVVSLALCDGMRGVIHLNGEKYFIEPLKNSSSAFSSSSSPSPSSLPLHRRPHIIYQQQPAKNHFSSNCSVTENFKHHRLKKTNASARAASTTASPPPPSTPPLEEAAGSSSSSSSPPPPPQPHCHRLCCEEFQRQ
ncbi:uncharacterized protein LOC143299618 [Babylonia areolata]|uniref:uncharacterized protein LOC143299618 n=1 Tax=Babylonia areolata TaxID=304850 RepID=UPI003FD0F964